MKNFFKMLFCSTETGEFSLTKAMAVGINALALIYFLAIFLFWYISGKAPDATVNGFAEKFFGIGSPVSIVGYIANIVQQRGGVTNIIKSKAQAVLEEKKDGEA